MVFVVALTDQAKARNIRSDILVSNKSSRLTLCKKGCAAFLRLVLIPPLGYAIPLWVTATRSLMPPMSGRYRNVTRKRDEYDQADH
jgi:hypothetical protein